MGVDIEFKNALSQPIELVVTANGQPMQVLANLAPGQSHVFNAQNGWAGNFKHTQAGKGVTQFEMSVKTKDDNIYYDLSVIDGFNVPMKVEAPDGTRIQALNAEAPDAYLFPGDNSKNHGLTQEGKFTVTFEG